MASSFALPSSSAFLASSTSSMALTGRASPTRFSSLSNSSTYSARAMRKFVRSPPSRRVFFAPGLFFVADVAERLALLDQIERRLGDVNVAALDELVHLAVEEGEQERADVGAVHVGVRHDDDLAVAKPRDVEVVLADSRAERGDEGADLLVREHLVEPRLLDVEDLAAQGQDGLVAAVASHLG